MCERDRGCVGVKVGEKETNLEKEGVCVCVKMLGNECERSCIHENACR